MDMKVLRTNGARIFAAILPLVFGAGNLAAQTNSPLLLTATATTVTCSTGTGTGTSGTITVKNAAAFSGAGAAAVTRIGVTVVAPDVSTGLTVTPSSGTLTSANLSTGLVFTVSSVSGCVNLTSGTTNVQFKAATGTATVAPSNNPNNDVAAVVTTTLINSSPLSVSPSTVNLTCVYVPAVGPTPASYTLPGPTTVSVTSGISGGSTFSLDGSTKPSWLTVAPSTIASVTAGTSVPYTFTVVPVAGCGGFALGQSRTANLKLTSPSPAADKFVTVTLTIVSASIMSVAPVLNPTVPVSNAYPASLVYTKASGTAGYVDLRITASAQVFFSVNTATLPSWLTVDSTTGTTPRNLRFSTTSVCDSLAPGVYTATLYLKVSGYADTAVPVSLQITNKAPRLTVSEGTTRNLNWTLGAPLPTAFVTAVSTDTPIPYTATTGGTLAPVIGAGQVSGLAYSFGTPDRHQLQSADLCRRLAGYRPHRHRNSDLGFARRNRRRDLQHHCPFAWRDSYQPEPRQRTHFRRSGHLRHLGCWHRLHSRHRSHSADQSWSRSRRQHEFQYPEHHQLLLQRGECIQHHSHHHGAHNGRH